MGIRYIQDSKNRLGALALANEKMETIRNLNFDQIGTINGIIPGSIAEEENITVNTKSYHVKTLVTYVDDEFDELFPDDTEPNDYKSVKITVSWSGVTGENGKVDLISNFTAPGLEIDPGTGVLLVTVADSNGLPISQANVHIVNNDLDPAVSVNQLTNDSGSVIFLNAMPAENYILTVSKNEYETVTTIDPDTVLYTPVDTNATVLVDYLNPKGIIIDKLADLEIKTIDNLGNNVPNVDFHIKGGRILGTRSADVPPEAIYILDEDVSTNSNGEKEFNGHSPGQFYLSDIESVSDHTLIGVYPISAYDATNLIYRFRLLSEEQKIVEIKYARNSDNSLLVKVLDNTDNSPINNAEVKLSGPNSYEATVNTGLDGVAFFPEDSSPLTAETYTLDVRADGFEDQLSVSVDINALTTEEIKLTAE